MRNPERSKRQDTTAFVRWDVIYVSRWVALSGSRRLCDQVVVGNMHDMDANVNSQAVEGLLKVKLGAAEAEAGVPPITS